MRRARFCTRCGAPLPPAPTLLQVLWHSPTAIIAGVSVASVALIVAAAAASGQLGGAEAPTPGPPLTAVSSAVPQLTGTPVPGATFSATSGPVPTSAPGQSPGPIDTATPDNSGSTDAAHVVSLQDSVTFPNQDPNTTSDPQTITLSNEGGTAQALGAPQIGGSNPDAFTVSSNECGSSIEAVTRCDVLVTFTPSGAGGYSAELDIVDEQGNTVVSVALGGAGGGAAEDVSVTAYSLDFGSINIGTSTSQSFSVDNNGTAAVTISAAQSGDSAFELSDECSGSLAAGTSCSEQVSFSPSDSTSYSGSITISDDSGNELGTVSLAGSGYDPNASSAVHGASTGAVPHASGPSSPTAVH